MSGVAMVVVVGGARIVVVTGGLGEIELQEQALERRLVSGGAVVNWHWEEMWEGIDTGGKAGGAVGEMVDPSEIVMVGVLVTVAVTWI